MQQREFRMPATGEGWRHYKGGPDSLYTIIGMAIDDQGSSIVVYTPHRWSLIQLPPIYTQPLGRFLQQIEVGKDAISGKSEMKPRFCFERPIGDDKDCPFIHPVTGTGFRDAA